MIPATLTDRTQTGAARRLFKIARGDAVRRHRADVQPPQRAPSTIRRPARGGGRARHQADRAQRGRPEAPSRPTAATCTRARDWAARAALHRFDRASARRAPRAAGRSAIRILAPDSDPVRLEAGRQVVLALTARRGAAPASRPVGRSAWPRRSARTARRRRSRRRSGALRRSPPTSRTSCGAMFGSAARPAELFGLSQPRRSTRSRSKTARATNPRSARSPVRSELQLLARDVPVVPLLLPGGRVRLPPADLRRLAVRAGIRDPRQALLPAARRAAGRGAGAARAAAVDRRRRRPELGATGYRRDRALTCIVVLVHGVRIRRAVARRK